MQRASRSEPIFERSRWLRSVLRGACCLHLLLPLLFGAGCFQPDEGVDDGTFPAWNPQLPPFDAAATPALGADAAFGALPPITQDAGGLPPIVDAGRDAMVPGFAPLDASDPFVPGPGAANDAAALQDAAIVVEPGPTGPPPTALSFSVLTKSLGGRYAPRNIGAIWIEDASGNWVKTLAVWAFIRERYLTRFRTASGGNRVDAVTGATLSQHTAHSVRWDLSDANGAPVPDGEYRLVVETTDRDATGDSTEVAFTKGTLPVVLMPPDVTHYVNMTLALQ
jgi:hypothetical protein